MAGREKSITYIKNLTKILLEVEAWKQSSTLSFFHSYPTKFPDYLSIHQRIKRRTQHRRKRFLPKQKSFLQQVLNAAFLLLWRCRMLGQSLMATVQNSKYHLDAAHKFFYLGGGTEQYWKTELHICFMTEVLKKI